MRRLSFKIAMTLYSNNLVFFDTEFSDLDPYKGEILSIGMVKMDGEELYLELEYEGELSDWVKERVLPALTEKKVSREEARERIAAFCGEPKPFPVALVPQYDMVYLSKLFGWEHLPVNWYPVDFASILFANGVDPEDYLERNDHRFIRKLGIDMSVVRVHRSIDDARLLREVFLKYAGV